MENCKRRGRRWKVGGWAWAALTIYLGKLTNSSTLKIVLSCCRCSACCWDEKKITRFSWFSRFTTANETFSAMPQQIFQRQLFLLCLNISFYEYTHDMKFQFALWCAFSSIRPSICFYIALDTEQIPYINHLMEKLMHMTVDSTSSRSVGIDDSILVGDDKSHFDRWNVKKLLFLLR